ncbi:MAG: hypothetical protein IJS58_00080 [Bacilli bacterium]|nr:hypothetical protein [Bacilli bacterium]
MFNTNKLIGQYLYDIKVIDIDEGNKNGLIIVTNKGVTLLELSAEWCHDCWITEIPLIIYQGIITEVRDSGYLLTITTVTGRNDIEARAEWGYETYWNERENRQIL